MIASRFRPVAALALLSAAAPLFSASLPFHLTTQLTTAWTEDISRSAKPADRQDAFNATAAAAVSRHRQLAPNLLLTFGGDAALFVCPDFRATDTLDASVSAALRQKLGLGPYALTLHGEFAFTGRTARYAECDGLGTRATLALSKRLSSTFQARLGAEWRHHDAREDTFDTSDTRCFAALAWDPAPGWRVSGGYTRVTGLFDANASWSTYGGALHGALGPAVQQYYNEIPWDVTDLYGSGWVTYRVEGTVSTSWIEIAPALSRATTLAFRHEHTESVNHVGIHYPQRVWSASLVHRF